MTNLTLRPARMGDAEMIFEWRNALETRQYFFEPSPLQLTEHLQWFNRSLTLPTRKLLIAEVEKTPIGVLRYDFLHSQAEIDIYVRPDLKGKGFGTQILIQGTEWLSKHFPEIKTLQGKVINENIASCRAFEKAGFNKKIQVYELNLGADE